MYYDGKGVPQYVVTWCAWIYVAEHRRGEGTYEKESVACNPT